MVEEERVEEILKRFAEMQRVRAPWESYWQSCTNYSLPNRSVWEEAGEEGKRPAVKLYDSRTVSDLRTMVNGFIGYMAPRSMPFFRLGVRDPRLKGSYGVSDWLEEVEEIVREDFERGGFYPALSEFVPDGMSTGTAYMSIRENVQKRRTDFSAHHFMECYIECDCSGRANAVARKTSMTIGQMAKEFGADILDREIRMKIESGNLGQRIDVLHLVLEREGVEESPLAVGISKPFASYYIDMEHRAIIREGGYDEFPWLVWLYSKNSNETYGRGPVMDALSAAIMGNQMGKSLLDLAHKVTDPPMIVPMDMKGSTRFTPGGLNYFTKDKMPQPIIFGANYPVTRDAVERNDRLISDHLHTDFFLLLQRAWDAGKPKTATEIMEMMGEKAAVLSTVIGNFESMVLSPAIMRTAAINERRGVLPEPPRALQGANAVLKIEFIGPLAMAAKRYQKQSGINAGLEQLARILSIDPKVIIRVDMDKLTKESLENSGMPASVIREDEDVKKIQEGIMKAQQAQQQQALQMEQSKTLIGNIDKLNQPAEPGSMLEKAGQMMGGAQ